MDCKRAEHLVTDYINGNIGLHDLEDFIAHIKCCSSCYDELQTYFIVYFAMEHLENEENKENKENNPSFNMNTVLVEDLKQKERYVKREKFKRFFLLATCILLFLVVLFLLIG